MEKHSEVFIGLDVAKARHAVAVAEDGRQGEVRYIGEIGVDTESVRRFVAKLEKRHGQLHFCYEVGSDRLWAPSTTDDTWPSLYGRRSIVDPA
jgi:transposase